MTRFLNAGISAVAWAGLLAAAILAMAPAKAQGVPASFDCAQAVRTVDRFICAHAVLRWQDLALSRSYAAAKAAAAGSARDELVRSQRDWVHERDRRCVADRSFKELSGPSNALQEQAYNCLDTVYLNRRRTLQDLGSKPLTPTDIAPIDLHAIEVARPELAAGSDVRIANIEASPDGSILAMSLPSQDIDLPDQVWLYRIADRRLVAATPAPDQGSAHPADAPVAIQALAWQDDMLYVRVAVWGPGDDGENSATVVYAATPDGNHRLDAVPTRIDTLLDAAAQSGAVEQDQVPKSDWDILETIRANHDFLAWTRDLGHGTIELRMRERTLDAPSYLVAWGSWPLWSYLFDIGRSQLIYAADTGITMHDMARHGERRVGGTARDDLPRAISANRRLLVWSTRNHCGDEFMTEPDEDAPELFCLAHLPKPKASP